MYHWYVVVSVDGVLRVQRPEELEPRPADARPEAGEPFRPWYSAAEHTHADGGAHVLARDERDALRRAGLLLERRRQV